MEGVVFTVAHAIHNENRAKSYLTTVKIHNRFIQLASSSFYFTRDDIAHQCHARGRVTKGSKETKTNLP
jgi:hypothetical protein